MPWGPPLGTSPMCWPADVEADVVGPLVLRRHAEQGGVHRLGLRQVGDRMQHGLDPLGGRVSHGRSSTRRSDLLVVGLSFR